MLATLNLQLLPIDLHDDAVLTPDTPAPGDGSEVATGFADLLRLGADASQLTAEVGGELLPPGGNELPIGPEYGWPGALSGTRPTPFLDPQLWQPKIESGLITLPTTAVGEGDVAVAEEAADLILEAGVVYPALPAEPIAGEESLTANTLFATVAPLSRPAADDSGARGAPREGRQDIAIDVRLKLYSGLNRGQSNPVAAAVVDAGEARAQILATEGNLPPPPGLALQRLGQSGEPPSRPALATPAQTALDAADKASLVDLQRRLDLAPLQRANGRPEPAFELPQPRVPVAHATPALSTQNHVQTSQPNLAMAPVSAASMDAGYAALAQQSTDLINTSVRDSAWGQQLGERVVMMASNHLKQAEIRLTPAELGPLRVQVSVDDGAAHVTFHAQHAVTRDALEQALPRLREMLAENGLSLGQADVSDRGVGEGGRDSDSDAESSNRFADDSHDASIDRGPEAVRRPTAISDGLVDTFA